MLVNDDCLNTHLNARGGSSDLIKLQDMIDSWPHGGIYGTGEAGKIVYDSISALYPNWVSFFLDRDECEKKHVRQLPVCCANNINTNIPIIIAANPRYRIHDRLSDAGIKKYMYIDPHILSNFSQNQKYFAENANKYDRNAERIERVRKMMADSISVEVIDMALGQRISPRVEEIQHLYNDSQYFGNDVVEHATGNFVDCGAFDGDTMKRFFNQLCPEDVYHYYAFEADRENYNKIKNYCIENRRKEVDIYNYCVWDKKEEVFFEEVVNGDEKTSGHIVDTNTDEILTKRFEADSLDNIIADKKIDMITMDIEGSEVRAINGARRIISEQRPILAISVYHTFEHIFEIPLLIDSICDGYRYYMRHHRWNIADTVCYAIPENKTRENRLL